MIKKFTVLILVLMFLIPLSGCVSARRKQRRIDMAAYFEKIKGWEHVRVEKKVPCKDCVYIIQEACGETGATTCYNWYKKQAKFYGGNVVVITEDVRSQSFAGSTSIAGSSYGKSSSVGGFGGFRSAQNMSALADYYNCPKYEIGENK
jgi:hypothetical protein